MGWQWHQLDHTQITGTLLQTDNHTSTSSLIFTGRMRFLTLNQQRQSTATEYTTSPIVMPYLWSSWYTDFNTALSHCTRKLVLFASLVIYPPPEATRYKRSLLLPTETSLLQMSVQFAADILTLLCSSKCLYMPIFLLLTVLLWYNYFFYSVFLLSW